MTKVQNMNHYGLISLEGGCCCYSSPCEHCRWACSSAVPIFLYLMCVLRVLQKTVVQWSSLPCCQRSTDFGGNPYGNGKWFGPKLVVKCARVYRERGKRGHRTHPNIIPLE